MPKIFMSHTWKRDELGRPTHERVERISKELQHRGMQVWLDTEQLVDDIDNCMASGIDDCDVVAIFITRAYVLKVESAASDPRVRDNCYKEFSYAQSASKVLLPVVFEPCMRSHAAWPRGIVKMHIGQKLFVDGSECSPTEVAGQMCKLICRISKPAPPPSCAALVAVRKAPQLAPSVRKAPQIVPQHATAEKAVQTHPRSRWLLLLQLVRQLLRMRTER